VLCQQRRFVSDLQLAVFNLTNSKLRGDVVTLRVEDIAPNGCGRRRDGAPEKDGAAHQF
jgi:hypothetical protein